MLTNTARNRDDIKSLFFLLKKSKQTVLSKRTNKIRFIFYGKLVKYRTIIVSDLHLGAPDSKYHQLIDFLQKNTCENLILNGDIIDGLYLKFFPKTRKKFHTEVLDKIIQLTTQGTKITYIQGNHDQRRYHKIPLNWSKIHIETEMIYHSGLKKYLICHGQQLDGKTPKRIEMLGFLSGVFIYRLNRKYNNRRKKQRFGYQSIVGKLKGLAKTIMTGGSKSIEKKIYNLCKKYKTDGCILGHLHHTADTYIGPFHYLNSGDRVESMTALAETHDHQREVIYH